MKSGKLILRLPVSIHEQATILARKEGVSLNQWLLCSVSMTVARADMGVPAVPQDRLEAIAADSFCGFPACKTHLPKIGICAACDAIYAAREALKARKKASKP